MNSSLQNNAELIRQEVKIRREHFFKKIEGGVAIIAAPHEAPRNHDVYYPFRQDSSFYYLTGFEEPESIAVFRNIGGKKEYWLFVRPRDLERELWDGYRAGSEGAKKNFDADLAFDLDEFPSKSKDFLKGAERVHFSLNSNLTGARNSNTQVLNILDSHRASLGRSGKGMLPIYDLQEILGEMRIFKSDYEVQCLKRACEISAKGHTAVMSRVRPGIAENQVQALIEYVFRNEGSRRVGYGSIVASGKHATVLHYKENTDVLKEKDFLLLDAGAEYEYYTGDITRTYNVSGKWTSEQKEIYQIVLDVQKECLALAKPGATLSTIHQHAVKLLTQAMIDLGFLTGRLDDLIQSLAYKRFYPHGTGHLLGMDVHDSGLYQINGQPRQLEPGMAFTVEPGFYIQPYDTSVPERYRGIGVRIEDNVLITQQGHDNMTSMTPKEIKDLEGLVGSQPWPTIL